MTTANPTRDVASTVDPTVASAATARAEAFVADRRPRAEALGTRLADEIQDPDAFATALRSGLEALADPEYRDGQRRIAPGLGPIHGVRRPLLAAIVGGLERASRDDRPTALLFVADRLFREPRLEARWFAFTILDRTLTGEPERSWQLLRRAAREAGDWITVDDLARPYAAGIDAEPYRWAELEQLVFSPSPWERRLIGSTIATLTHGRRAIDGADLVATALPLLDQLMGDADPDVQKALSWAYRSLAPLDAAAVSASLHAHADRAVSEDDGHRAWVIRDSLAKLDPTDADGLRTLLAGIHRRSGAPSTSTAAETAARFGELPDPTTHPEPPLA